MTDTTTKADKKSHFGSRAHRISQLTLLGKRVDKARGVFAGTSVADILADALEAVNDAGREAALLPDDWRPAGRVISRKVKVVLVVGDQVQIKAKKQAKYTDLLSAAEMGDLTISAIVGKKARCTASTGVAVLIPLSQVSKR
jgi:hypothetical protein